MGYRAKHMDGTVYWHADSEGERFTADGERCGGTGFLDCYCGGDMCVCGNFGEVECYGCPDCDDADDFDDFDDLP